MLGTTNPLIAGFENRLTELVDEALSLGLSSPQVIAVLQRQCNTKVLLQREIELQHD